MMECELCQGKGYVVVLANSADHYYNAAYPEYDEEPCEECSLDEDEDEG